MKQRDFAYHDSPWESGYYDVIPPRTCFDSSAPDLSGYFQGATNQAMNLQKQIYGETQDRNKPWVGTGQAATGQAGSMLGLPGSPVVNPTQQLESTPGYQWALSQGLGALNRNDAASGNLYSGAHQKGIVNYATGLADQTYQSYLNNLFNVSNQGLNASGMTGQAGMNYANTGSNLLMSNAQAQASNAMNQYNANQNMWGQVGGLLGMGLGALTTPFSGSSLLGKGASYLFG